MRRACGLRAVVAGVGVVGLLLVPGEGRSAPPTLSHLFPAGGQRGSRVIVTCTGRFSSWPVQVWAPGLAVRPAKEPGKLEVSVPCALAADRVWIRLYNAEGSAAPAPFLIGSLKEIDEREPNNRPRDAQAIIDPNVTVNGVLTPGDVDCFRVRLAAGQTLVAAVDAYTRLGSPIDAVLQVASADGAVLAENHDDVQLDPRLAFTAAASGNYVVRLFAFPSTPGTDIHFGGGANCVYRLTLTTGPFLTHTVPLCAPRSHPGTVEVHGWNVPPGTRLPVVPFGGARPADVQEYEVLEDLRVPPDARLGLVFAPHFAGAARVRLTTHGVVPALAATTPANPMALMPPVSTTGRLRAPRQADEFRVPLRKGQPVVVSVESHSLDFPLDPVVKLLDPAGNVVVDVDDSGGTRDVAFTHAAARDGIYRLVVGDRYRHGGERCFYRVTVRPEESDFELAAGTDGVVVAPGKPAELPVKVRRRTAPAGSVGRIAVEAVGLPPGVTAPAVISEPTGPSAADVTLKLSTTGPAFSGPIRISGKTEQPKPIQRFARTPAKLGASFETVWLTALAPGAPKSAR